MRLTADVRLTRNSRSVSSQFGCENSGSSTWQSVIRGHHIYKQIQLRPLVGEILTLEWEESNNHDKFVVSLLKDATHRVVGHGPGEFSRVFWHFFRHGGTITCKDTGRRNRSKWLEIPILFVLRTTSPRLLIKCMRLARDALINCALNKYYALNKELRLTTSAYGISKSIGCESRSQLWGGWALRFLRRYSPSKRV